MVEVLLAVFDSPTSLTWELTPEYSKSEEKKQLYFIAQVSVQGFLTYAFDLHEITISVVTHDVIGFVSGQCLSIICNKTSKILS